MRFTTTRDIKFFHGILPAGSVVHVLSANIYRDGIGMGPIFADDCLEYLDAKKLGPESIKPSGPPWVGPDATVKVPEFVPAVKAEEARSSAGGGQVASGGRNAVKPAQGQKSMFELMDEI